MHRFLRIGVALAGAIAGVQPQGEKTMRISTLLAATTLAISMVSGISSSQAQTGPSGAGSTPSGVGSTSSGAGSTMGQAGSSSTPGKGQAGSANSGMGQVKSGTGPKTGDSSTQGETK
jgi:hypothetical protein